MFIRKNSAPITTENMPEHRFSVTLFSHITAESTILSV